MRTRLCATPITFHCTAYFALLSLLAFVVLLPGCGGSSTPGALSTITLSPNSMISIAIGAQQTFTATAADSGGRTITGLTFTWLSSSPDVASIDTAGVATGHRVGMTEITATSGGVSSTSVALTVTDTSTPVASVSLSPISANIKVGQTQQFTASALDASGNAVSGVTFTWRNSAAGVAILSTSGLATGTSPGTALITASVGMVTSPVATLNVTAP